MQQYLWMRLQRGEEAEDIAKKLRQLAARWHYVREFDAPDDATVGEWVGEWVDEALAIVRIIAEMRGFA